MKKKELTISNKKNQEDTPKMKLLKEITRKERQQLSKKEGRVLGNLNIEFPFILPMTQA